MSSSSLHAFLYQAIWIGPTVLVLMVGVVLALRNLYRHPRPCWALLAALALTAINLASSFVLPILLESAVGMALIIDSGSLWLMYSLFHSVLNAASWGLVLFAVFDRPDRPKFLVEEDLERDILDQ